MKSLLAAATFAVLASVHPLIAIGVLLYVLAALLVLSMCRLAGDADEIAGRK